MANGSSTESEDGSAGVFRRCRFNGQKVRMDHVSRLADRAYWSAAVAAFGFGLIAVVSIGFLPLLLAAMALVVLSPLRARPPVFWTVLALVVGFLVGYVLFAPWSCAWSWHGFSPRPQDGPSLFVCHSLVGNGYVGVFPVWPGVIAGMGGGLIGAALVRLSYRSVRSSDSNLQRF
jgi:hypothetical protein